LASLKPAARVVGDDLFDLVDAQRARAQHRIVAALDGERYTELLARLEEAVHRPKVVATGLSLPTVAASQFVKRARYAAELAQPTVGRPAERFVARAKKLQDILGEYQDAVVAEECLYTLVEDGRSSLVGLVANRLVKRQRPRRQAAQMHFFEQWPKLERRGRKAW
jgi:CHAD domain-containing protein